MAVLATSCQCSACERKMDGCPIYKRIVPKQRDMADTLADIQKLNPDYSVRIRFQVESCTMRKVSEMTKVNENAKVPSC